VKLCRLVSGLSRKTLERMKSVPKRRAEALPYGALVMEEMIHVFGLKEVVVSAYGLREGVLQRKLSPAEAAKAPLLAFARALDERESRTPGLGQEMARWMAPLFPKETDAERRIREAACLFSDIGWRRHPDDRAMGGFVQVLRGAYGGADHHERALMAASLYYRYAGDDDFPEDTGIAPLLGPEGAVRALQIGLAARLAYGLTGAVAGALKNVGLVLAKDTLTLEMPSRKRALLGETVEKRLDDLADAFSRRPVIETV
jgi:exopolyphosphatase/guanosine-5'-triphosphate,3'-diphosphate pyrophosphatase